MRRRVKFGPDGKPLAMEFLPTEGANEVPPRTLSRIAPPASLADTALSVVDAKRMVDLVQQVAKEVMIEGRHYGKPPGAKRAMLYQAGAQILDVTFRLCPSFEVIENVRNDGYLETTVRCILTHIPTGHVFATAIGSANSLEDRYQKQIATRKVSPYDLANTLLKIAGKRAHQTATINATAAGDIFAPDLDEDPETGEKLLQQEAAATPAASKMQTVDSKPIDVVPHLSDGQHAAILERMARLGQSTASLQFKGWLASNFNAEGVKNLTVSQAEHVIQTLDKRLTRDLEAAANKVAGEMGVKSIPATTTIGKGN